MIWNTRNRVVRTALIVAGSAFLFVTSSSAASYVGGTTSVALNPTTYATLTGPISSGDLGFTIGLVGNATLTGLTVSFPITGGTVGSMIDHSGGLSFTLGTVTTDISNFVINLTAMPSPVISGNVAVFNNGVQQTIAQPVINLFDVGMATAGGLPLAVDAQLAGDLAGLYSVANLTGASIGTATINAVVSPEPATISIAAVGLIAAGAMSLRKRRSSKA